MMYLPNNAQCSTIVVLLSPLQPKTQYYIACIPLDRGPKGEQEEERLEHYIANYTELP